MYVSIILATLLIQIPNIWAINYFSSKPTIYNAFYISFLCIPFSFLSTSFYAYYYGVGYQKLNYPSLAILAYGVSLLCSFIIQFVVLKNKTFVLVDYFAIFFVLLGISLFIYREEITSYFL